MLQILPATPDRADLLADLMDDVAPARRCSCMYWRLGPAYRERDPSENRSDLRAILESGPPPGLLAIDGDRAVGWCQVTPRSDLAALGRSRLAADATGESVWSISCFVIRKGHRRKGISTALVEAGVQYARDHGATVVEAYPLNADSTTSSSFTGYVSTFARLGFATISRPTQSRAVMRRDL